MEWAKDMPEPVSKPIPQGPLLHPESNMSWEAARPGDSMAKKDKTVVLKHRSSGTAGQAKGGQSLRRQACIGKPIWH